MTETERKISKAGWLAIGLALVGSVAAFVNVAVGYQETGAVDWGRVALAVGVPIFMYAIVSSASAKKQ